MDERRKDRNALFAAAVILIGFGLLAYFLPTIMLAAGEVSSLAAIAVAVGFVALFFLIFWIRSKRQ